MLVVVSKSKVDSAVSRRGTQSLFINVRAVRHAILEGGAVLETAAHPRLFGESPYVPGVREHSPYSKLPVCSNVSGFFLPNAARKAKLTSCPQAFASYQDFAALKVFLQPQYGKSPCFSACSNGSAGAAVLPSVFLADSATAAPLAISSAISLMRYARTLLNHRSCPSLV